MYELLGKISPHVWKPLLHWDQKIPAFPLQRPMKELGWPTVTGTVLALAPKPGTPYSQQTRIVDQLGGLFLRQSDAMRPQTVTQRWN